jgi:hypothetical protein
LDFETLLQKDGSCTLGHQRYARARPIAIVSLLKLTAASKTVHTSGTLEDYRASFEKKSMATELLGNEHEFFF